MRRVVITGLGAVTPIGLDAPSSWDAAVTGRSVHGWIAAIDASEYPVRIAAEVRGFDPGGLVPPKEARRMDRNGRSNRRTAGLRLLIQGRQPENSRTALMND